MIINQYLLNIANYQNEIRMNVLCSSSSTELSFDFGAHNSYVYKIKVLTRIDIEKVFLLLNEILRQYKSIWILGKEVFAGTTAFDILGWSLTKHLKPVGGFCALIKVRRIH